MNRCRRMLPVAARLVAKDGICRRSLILAIVARARSTGRRVPSHAKIAHVLGCIPQNVSYHFRRIGRLNTGD